MTFLEQVNKERTVDYLVYKDGTDTVAVNGSTGKEDSRDTSAATVIQYALDNLTGGRTHKETVAFKGAFTIAAAIVIPSYTILDFNGASLTLKDSAGFHMLQIGDGTTGVTDVEIMHGVFDGNRANQSAEKNCIYAQDLCHRINIHDNYFTGWYGKAVTFNGGTGVDVCTWASVCNNIFDDFEPAVDSDGVEYNYVKHGVISGNLIKDAGDDAIDLGASDDICIIGNTIEDSFTGIEVGISKATIIGNALNDIGSYGIVLDGCQSTTVMGNYMFAVDLVGIRMLYARGCSVIGNTIWRASNSAHNTYNAIHIADKAANHSSHNVISGNVNVADGGQKTKYMVEEEDVNQDYNVISNNVDNGSATGNIHKQGANSIASDNI